MSRRFASGLVVLLLSGPPLSPIGKTRADDSKQPQEPRLNMTSSSPLGIAWGFIYGAGDVKAHVFMPQVRQLGASHTKLYLFWNQLEPKKGEYDWSALDAFLDQLQSPEEAAGLHFPPNVVRWSLRRESALDLAAIARQEYADDFTFVSHPTVWSVTAKDGFDTGRTTRSRITRSSGRERGKSSSPSSRYSIAPSKRLIHKRSWCVVAMTASLTRLVCRPFQARIAGWLSLIT